MFLTLNTCYNISVLKVTVLLSSAVDRQVSPRTIKLVLLLLHQAYSIKEYEQRLVGSESGECVSVATV